MSRKPQSGKKKDRTPPPAAGGPPAVPVAWFEDQTFVEPAARYLDDDATMLRPPTPVLTDEDTQMERPEEVHDLRTRVESVSFLGGLEPLLQREDHAEDPFEATRIEYFEVTDTAASETEEADTPAPGVSTRPRRDLRFIELAAERLAVQFDAPDPPSVVSLPRNHALAILTRAARIRPRNTVLLHQAVRLRLERGRLDHETAGLLAELCRRRLQDDALRSELADLLHEIGEEAAAHELDLYVARPDSSLTPQARHRHLLRAAVTLPRRSCWTGGITESIVEAAADEGAPDAVVLGVARAMAQSWQPHPHRRAILEKAARVRPHDKELKLMALEAAALDGSARDTLRPALELLSDPEVTLSAARALAAAASTIRQMDASAIPRELLLQAARNEDCLPDEAIPAIARLLIILGHATPAEIRVFQRACDLEPDDEEFRRALAASSRADRRQASDFLFDVLQTTEMDAGDLSTPREYFPPTLFRNLSEAAQGRYDVREKLGSGAMGEVLLALDRELDELVVLKIMPRDSARDKNALDAFRNEARTARRLSHPNIVRIHDIGEFQGVRMISMEYLPGGDLRSRLERLKGVLPINETVSIIRQVARALAHAHGAGVLHLDVKPGNVLLDPSGHVKLTDFGIASVMRDAPDSRTSRELMGQSGGTPLYMSPEQFDDRDVSPASDLYSLGIMFYEMVATHPPFTTGALAYHHEFTPPPPLPLDVPEAIQRAIMKCLRKKPSDRFQKAQELLRALDDHDGSRLNRG